MSPSARKELMPRTKVSMRPSGERAGWVTESGKLVSLTYCDVDVVGLFERRIIRPPIASKEARTMPIPIQGARRPRHDVREVTTAGREPAGAIAESVSRFKRTKSVRRSAAL